MTTKKDQTNQPPPKKDKNVKKILHSSDKQPAHLDLKEVYESD